MGTNQSYRSNCKVCRSEVKLIRELKIKYKIISDLFKGKCGECETNAIFLPGFEFHHMIKKNKKLSWRSIKGKSYDFILNWIKTEKVIPLCGNCHSKKQAKYYDLFMDLILHKNLFQHTPEELEKIIDLEIENKFKEIKLKNKPNIKYQLKQWIKKRYVIEKLFDGECIGCKKVNVINDLPSLVFHHLDPEKKELNWQSLQNLDTKEILNNLIKEKVVCLCFNCHSIIHSKYNLLVQEILTEFLSEIELENFKSEVSKKIDLIKRNINFFNFNIDDKDIHSLLKLDFSQNNIWEKHLLEIFYFSQKTGLVNFRINDLRNFFDKTFDSIYGIVRKLVNRNYLKKIKSDKFTQERFTFTPSGKLEIKKLEIKHKKKAQEMKKIINAKNFELIDMNKSRFEYDDVLLGYPVNIYNIIQKKKFNEFISKDLTVITKRSTTTISRNLKEVLLPNGIIKELEIPIYTEIKTTQKVYKLTNYGIQLVKRQPIYKDSIDSFTKPDLTKIKNYIINIIIIIYWIIKKRNFNEFTNNEVSKQTGFINNKLNQIINNNLIPLGLVSIIKNPTYIHTKDRTVIYQLTDKSLNILRELIN
jgi:hypothetical protein